MNTTDTTAQGIEATQFQADDSATAHSGDRAQYNIADDRFKFWPSVRLSPADYAEAKACKFQWFPGQKCFSAIWRPQAEDFLARLGVQIEDICEVDDVAARVERFSKYAGNAEESAQRAADRLADGSANTRRRAEGAERVAVREFGTAAHWQRRIAGAISAANYKENPGAIMRRIETLETEQRVHQRMQQVEDIPGSPGSVFVGNVKGRGQGHWLDRDKLAGHLAWEKRWTDHIEHRLEYERARLAATGHTLAKIASNEIVLEVGGAIKCNRRRVNAEGWYYITKLNPASVEIYAPHSEEWRGKWIKVPRDEIGEVATAAQVKAGEVQCDEPPAAKPSSQPKGTQQARDGKTPEKFGAFGSSGGFVDRLTDPDLRWYLITKVNKTTVEYLAKQQFSRADKSTYWQYYIKKTDIRGLSFVKTPAEVKAAHPDLLADWARVEELRAQAEARKAAQPAEATA